MLVHIIRKSTIQRVLLLCVIGIGCAALLIWPQGAATGVSRGLSVCGTVIIPSLFPFLVLTGVFIRSGLAGRVGRRLDRVIRFLFGLPGCCGAAVLVGAIGGYPAGAAAVRDLLRGGEITEAQAKKLLRFCVNGGPAFLIGTVGAGLLGSAWKGVVLYIAHLLASLLIGLTGRGIDTGEEMRQPPVSRRLPLMKTLVESVESACASLLSMCGFVVLFAAMLTLSDVSGLTAIITGVLSFPFTAVELDAMSLTSLFTAVWEVSCGCVAVAGSGLRGIFLFFLLGAALGWGGVSVHCQIGGMFSDYKVMDGSYVLARLWQALLGGVLSALLVAVVPSPAPTATVMAGGVPAVQMVSVSTVASAAMLMMCGAVLLCVSRDR